MFMKGTAQGTADLIWTSPEFFYNDIVCRVDDFVLEIDVVDREIFVNVWDHVIPREFNL